MAFPSPSQFAGGRVMGRSYPLQGAQRCTVQSMVGGWWLILLAEWWQTSTVLSHCSMVESKNNAKETSKNKSSSIKWDTSNTMQSRRSPHQSPNPPEHVELYTTNKCDWCPNRFQWGYFGHKVSNAALVDKGDTSPFFTSIEIDWYTKMPSGNEWLIHGTSIWIPYELWTYGWQISQIPVVFFCQNHWDHDRAVSRCAKTQSRSAARSSRPPPGGPVGRSRPALAPGEPPHRRHSPAQTSSNCVNCGWAETCEGNGDFLSANWGANLPRSSLLGIPKPRNHREKVNVY